MSKKIDLTELAKAHVHYGHLAKNWDPNFAPYIYQKKGDHHIIDLRKTAANLERSCDALQKIAATGRKILFVSTKKQIKSVVSEVAEKSGMPYVTERWLGGMLTNLVTIRKAVKKMTAIDRMKKDGTFETLSKRERLQLNRQREKLDINLGSISDMTRLPGALFIIDIKREHIAIKEARKLGIPVFAVVDSNSNPNLVDFPIPANDDVSRSVSKILDYVFLAIEDGKEKRKSENASKEKDSDSTITKPKPSKEVANADKPADTKKEIVQREAPKAETKKAEPKKTTADKKTTTSKATTAKKETAETKKAEPKKTTADKKTTASKTTTAKKETAETKKAEPKKTTATKKATASKTTAKPKTVKKETTTAKAKKEE